MVRRLAKMILLASLLTFLMVADAEKLKGFLMYEDQKQDICTSMKCWNVLTLKKKLYETEKSMKDFTVCFRLNLLSYREKGKDHNILRAKTTKYVTNVDMNRDWTTGFHQELVPVDGAGNGVITIQTFSDKLQEVILNDGVYTIWPIYPTEVNANQWNSFCFGSNLKDRNIFLARNGKTLHNFSQPQLWADLNIGLDTSALEPFQATGLREKEKFGFWRDPWHGIYLAENMRSVNGYFTDFQWFGRALSQEEVSDITTCKSFPKGDIYSFDPDDWEVFDKELQKNDSIKVQYRVVDLDKSSLCKTEKKYAFFPDTYQHLDGSKLCERFGGRRVDVSSKQKFNEVAAYLGTIKDDPSWNEKLDVTTYTMFTDEEEFNVWKNHQTGELPEDPLVWAFAEPNGGMVENCAQVWINKDENGDWEGSFNDQTCTRAVPVACEGIGEVVLTFRGLCAQTAMDTIYTMVNGDMNKKRFFSGNFGWKIHWDSQFKKWKLGNTKIPEIYAFHTQSSTYPLGKNYWQVVNDTRCAYQDHNSVYLNLSPCNSSSFTCDNGVCIQMTKRCDQNTDCEDISDEKGCKIVVIDENNYLKDKPPKETIVKVKIELLKILEIGEVEMLFRNQFKLYMEWFDSRVTFYNLHQTQGLNTLVEEEKQKIWTPSLIFDNTDQKVRTTTDKESLISVKREGNFSRNTFDNVDNVYLYDGEENPLEMSRVYHTGWICDYQMNWYPFDTQLCSMTISVTEDLNDFITLEGNGHENLGPVELTQYFIRNTEMNINLIGAGQQAVIFKVTLGRRLLGTILTVFLPTVLLNVIGHSANYFKAFFFEAVVSVNLTVMLVLTTMFINVSNRLPNTSYIKMIDVWLIFNLIVPFVEVLLHTYKDYLREEGGREVNHHGRVRKLGDEDGEQAENEPTPGVSAQDVNNWVGSQGGELADQKKLKELKLNLVSRREDVQVDALREYYSGLVTSNEKRLERADYAGFTVIPRIAISFVACYWILGICKYKQII